MSDREHFWGKTEEVLNRLQNSPFFYRVEGPERETGYYGGRRVIGRDTEINGGVYLGGGEREAVVVDDIKYPTELDEAYQAVMARAILPGKNIFNITSEVVSELLGGNQGKSVEEKVKKIYEDIDKTQTKDPKIKLNHFMQAKAGVCRHRALLAGYIIERAIKEGKLNGKVSVDRNDNGVYGHAWVRYMPKTGGEPIIIDPSLGYTGRISLASPKWNYRRPGE